MRNYPAQFAGIATLALAALPLAALTTVVRAETRPVPAAAQVADLNPGGGQAAPHLNSAAQRT